MKGEKIEKKKIPRKNLGTVRLLWFSAITTYNDYFKLKLCKWQQFIGETGFCIYAFEVLVRQLKSIFLDYIIKH